MRRRQKEFLSQLDHVLASSRDLHAVRDALAQALDGADPATLEYVHALLMDPDAELTVRVEAALALGAHGGAAGAAYLRRAYDRIEEDLLIGSILDGLAQTPFDPDEGLLAELVRDQDADGETREMALEALGEYAPASRNFLLDVAASDPAPYMRKAAAEAVKFISQEEGTALPLALLALQEEDPGVRAEFYAAVAADNYDLTGLQDADDLARKVAEETLPRARLDGVRMLAAAINVGNSGFAAEFDAVHVPWIKQAADNGLGSYELRLALDALTLSRSERAMIALNELAISQRVEVAAAAGDALALIRHQ